MERTREGQVIRARGIRESRVLGQNRRQLYLVTSALLSSHGTQGLTDHQCAGRLGESADMEAVQVSLLLCW
jgi:hypothetical protein